MTASVICELVGGSPESERMQQLVNEQDLSPPLLSTAADMNHAAPGGGECGHAAVASHPGIARRERRRATAETDRRRKPV